ncbi:serine/threonine-protein kinase [Kribbella sp. VKM Ac-2568]|uniref:serine/threonine-protein kinase n=1 Tax=Kribbella sp. VKM Ac-2568 TaxID=2512219 RepID=UPI001F546C0C|nr:serine/threonine-protein kinase [Kribbella sp. VKM Ac-2568]
MADRYQLGEVLGRGGMGEVFRAVDEVLGRPVAVKLLRPLDHDPAAAAERFRREARAAAILNDTHVVAVYDFGQHGDRSYLVMELVEGRSVAEELSQTGPLPRDRAVDIIEQAAAGLAAAHRRDIVHRDIKPGNLLLTTDGTVKIADFGIAHLADEGAATLTVTGQIIGSTHYLAPERAQGRQAGKPSDIYALGCVLYQLVVGHPPFTAEHPTAILYQHVDTEPPRPSHVHPELGGPFEAVLLRMLAKDPAARPTATEIAAGALRAPAGTAPTGAAGAAAAGLAVSAATQESSPATLTDLAVPAAAAVAADQLAGGSGGSAGEATDIAAADAAEPTPDAGTPTGAPALLSGAGRRKHILVGAAALLATAAAVVAGVLINGDETKPPATINLDPSPSVAPSTPGQTPRPTETSTNRTQPGAVNQTEKSTPTRSPSQQSTPTPGTSQSGTPSTGTPPPGTQSPSAPTLSSNTPSAPTQGTPSTSTASPPDPSPSSRPSTSTTPEDNRPPAANAAGPGTD